VIPNASVRVVVFQHGLGALDYAVPPGLDVAAGDAVAVPLGPRTITGVVWDEGRLAGREVEAKRLRPIAAKLDMPPLALPLRRLSEWVADYYLSPLAGVIRMVWPQVAFLGSRELIEYRLGGPEPARATPERARAIAALVGR
jgi:primosomal protein N' (replication factor Y) (superfamily II helicase)